MQHKSEERARKILSYINDQFASTTTMSLLAEAESLACYGRKRLALTYEQPNIPQSTKSHSPNVQNMAWDVSSAITELENFPPHQKINWSEMARRYTIPNRNAGQVLKETAKKHGIDTLSLEHNTDTTPRIRKRKSRLPEGEISVPCLPTVSAIKEERRQLILSGELNIGEPCATFHLYKFIITEEGNIEVRSVEICGRKIALTDLRKALLNKQERYMHLYSDAEIHNMSKVDITAHLTNLHIQHEVTPHTSLDELQSLLATLQRTRTLAMWHDHSTILQTGYILFAVWVVCDPAIFYAQDQWKRKQRGQGKTHSIPSGGTHDLHDSPSSSSPADQLALVGDCVEGTFQTNHC